MNIILEKIGDKKSWFGYFLMQIVPEKTTFI
jgi:hypothetical protein